MQTVRFEHEIIDPSSLTLRRGSGAFLFKRNVVFEGVHCKKPQMNCYTIDCYTVILNANFCFTAIEFNIMPDLGSGL